MIDFSFNNNQIENVDQSFRKLPLYPTELRGHSRGVIFYLTKKFTNKLRKIRADYSKLLGFHSTTWGNDGESVRVISVLIFNFECIGSGESGETYWGLGQVLA